MRLTIDNALSRRCRVTRQRRLCPTQILADPFRDANDDAIVYQSRSGETGYKLALSDNTDAEEINRPPAIRRDNVHWRPTPAAATASNQFVDGLRQVSGQGA